jgi:hypothetical protein
VFLTGQQKNSAFRNHPYVRVTEPLLLTILLGISLFFTVYLSFHMQCVKSKDLLRADGFVRHV